MGLGVLTYNDQFFAEVLCDRCGQRARLLRSRILASRHGRRVIPGTRGPVYGTTFVICDALACQEWLQAFARERGIGAHDEVCSGACACPWVTLPGDAYLFALLSGHEADLIHTAAAWLRSGQGSYGPVMEALAAAAPALPVDRQATGGGRLAT